MFPTHQWHAPEVELNQQGQGPTSLASRSNRHFHRQRQNGGKFVTICSRRRALYIGHTPAKRDPADRGTGRQYALAHPSSRTRATARSQRTAQSQVEGSSPARSAGITPATKRQLRRRPTVETVMGHFKAGHRFFWDDPLCRTRIGQSGPRANYRTPIHSHCSGRLVMAVRNRRARRVQSTTYGWSTSR